MGSSQSRTVQTLRLDHMEQGSSQKKRAKDELAFLERKLLEAENEENRVIHAAEMERVKRDTKCMEHNSPIDVCVRN
jgi:hypothetical protein